MRTDDEFLEYLVDTFDAEELLDIANITVEELVELLRDKFISKRSVFEEL